MIIALLYFINSIVTTLGFTLPVLSYIGGMSLLPLIYMDIASRVYRFCSYHRLFLYYIVIDDSINIVDQHFVIPIDDLQYLMMHTCIAFIFIVGALYKHLHYDKTNKEVLVTANR